MLRVLHIASGDAWGGAEAMILMLAKEQSACGQMHCKVVLMNSGRLSEELECLGIPALVLNEQKQGFLSLLRSTIMCIWNFQPDVVHSHRQKENVLTLCASVILRTTGFRFSAVATIHGLPETKPGGPNFRRRVSIRSGFAALKYGFDAVVAVSNDIQQRFSDIIPAQNLYRIYNGIAASFRSADCPRESPKRIWPRELQLVALGRLVPVKRYDRLPELSNGVRSVTGITPHIRLFGEGPLELQLRSLFNHRRQISNIELCGYRTNTDDIIFSADAVLITSDHEGIPMVALEALRQGIPVFSFDIGGLPEIARHSSNIHLSPPYNAFELGRLVAQKLKDMAGNRQCPDKNWAFSSKTCHSEYRALYERLAKSRRH